MDNLARTLAKQKVVEEVGRVILVDGESLVVRTISGSYRCKRAASSLVDPQPGDPVLVVRLPGERCYVLDVVEREAGTQTRITLPGDLAVELPSGRLQVSSEQGIDLLSGAKLNIVSHYLNVCATEGDIALRRLRFVGRYLRSHIEKVSVAARSAESMLDRFSQTVKRSYRTVLEHEQLRAESIRCWAKQTISIQSGDALVTAKKLVKLNGEQVHMG